MRFSAAVLLVLSYIPQNHIMMQVFLEGVPGSNSIWEIMSENCDCLPKISINYKTLVDAWTAVW